MPINTCKPVSELRVFMSLFVFNKSIIYLRTQAASDNDIKYR